MANISYTKVGDTTYPLSLPYCVCGTTASTAAKTADLANFSLDEGTTVHVKFTNANTATTPTLNINGTGAKGIKAYGTTAPSVNWKAGAVVEFVYDGTNYVMTNVGAIPDGTCTVSGGGLSKGTASGGGLSGGALSGGGLSAGAGAATITTAPVVTPNVGGTVVGKTAYGVTTTKPSGTDGTNYVTIDPGATVTTTGKAKGKGTVSRATINRAQVDRAAFSQSVTRADIKDAHTAGYIPAKSATTVISGTSETVSLASGKLDAASIASASQDSNWSSEINITPSVGDGTNYYIPMSSTSATGGSASVAVTGMVTTTTDTGYKVSASATGGSASVTAGLTSGGSASGTSASTVTFINAGVESFSGGGLSKGTASGGGLSGGALSGGDLSAGAGAATITTAPVVTPSVGGTVVGKTAYGVTTTKPSGTDGTNYFTIDPGGSVTTTGKAKGKGTVSRATINRAQVDRAAFSQAVTRATITEEHNAGYFPASTNLVLGSGSETVSLAAGKIDATSIASTSKDSNWSSEVNITPSVGAGTNYYVPVVSPSVTGGSASVAVTGMVTTTTDTGYKVSASAAGGSASIGAGITSGGSSSGGSAATVTFINAGVESFSGGGLSKGTATGGTISGGGLSGGGLNAGTGEVSITANPVVTPSVGGTVVGKTTYGVTTTKPSGTDGTNYFTIDPGASVTEGKAKGRGTVSRDGVTRAAINRAAFSQSVTRATITEEHNAGYFPASTNLVLGSGSETVSLAAGSIAADTTTIPSASKTSNWSGESSTSSTVTAGTNYYVPVVTATATNGTASASATITKAAGSTITASSATITVSGMTTTTTATSYKIIASANSGFAKAWSGKAKADASATGGSASVGAGITSGASASGTSTGAKSAETTESTAQTTAQSAATTIYIPAGVCTVAGGGLSKGTASGGGLSGGTLNSGSGEVSITANPVVTPSIGGTVVGKTAYGVTTTKPSGTDGTNYFTIDPGASVTEGKAKGRGTVTRDAVSRAAFSQAVTRANITDAHTAGYIPDKAATTVIASASETVSLAADTTTIPYASKTSSWSSESSTSSTVTAGTNYYVPVVTATATGGSASASATITKAAWSTITASSATITTSGITTSETATSYVIVAKANSGFAKAGSGVAKADASANGGSASVGAGITTGATASGTSTGAKSAQTTESTAQTTAQTATATIYLPAGSASVASSTYSGVVPTISGTTYTAQVDVTPDVNTGWILSGSGLPGTIKITGTVPTESKAATGSGTVSPTAGKLLSSVTVAAGTVTYSDTALACTPNAKTTTASASNSNITLGSRTTTAPASGLYLTVTGGSEAKTGESCTVTRGAGWVAAGTASITSSASATTNTGYYPVSIAAGTVTSSDNALAVSPSAKATTATASNTNITIGSSTTTAPSSGLYITTVGGSNAANGESSTITKKAGWIAAGTFAISSNAVASTDTRYFPVTIKSGSVTASDTALNCTPAAKTTTGALSSSSKISLGSRTTTAPTSGLYLTVTGGSSAKTGESCTITKSAGWIAAGTIGISSSASETTSTGYYPVTIPNGYLSVPDQTKSSDETTLNGTTITLKATPTGGTVTMPGWVENADAFVMGAITITGTVPTQTKAASGSGTVSPDSGKLLSSVTVAAGTVTLSDTALSCTPSVKTTTATASNSNITLGSRTTTAPTSGLYLTVTGGSSAKTGETCLVTKGAGWIAAGTVNVTSSAGETTSTGYYPVTIKSGSVTVSDVDLVVTPVASASASASNSNITLASATTTEPSSGLYLTVSGSVPATSGESSLITKAAGWIAAGTVSVASRSTASTKILYYPVTIASGSVTASDTALSCTPSAKSTTASASNSNITLGSRTTTAPSSGLYLTVTGGSSAKTGESCTVTKTAGWISGGTIGISSSAAETTNTGYYPVTIKAGDVTASDTALACTPNAKTTTATASNTNITLGTRVTTAPASGLYITVTGGSEAKTGESCTVTKTAGWINAGTIGISSSASATTNTGYYPVTIKSGSAAVGATTVTPSALTGSWNASTSKYVVSQASKTVSISGSVTTGWVTTISSGTITLSPMSYEISGGVITNNTSGGSSAGTINSGSQIKIGAGYYPNDLYYTAASGGGSWDWSGNLTIDGNPGAPNEQNMYIFTGDSDSYSAVFTSTGGGYGAKSGYCTGYMNYSAGNNAQLCDYYQFDACTSSSPLKVIYMSSSSSWAFMIGSYWYDPGNSYTTNTYYKMVSFSGAPRVYYIELWPEPGIGSIMMRYRAL